MAGAATPERIITWLGDFARAWVALLIAFWPASLIGLVIGVGGMPPVLRAGDIPDGLEFVFRVGLRLALACAVAGAPLLLFRRWIVGPKPPFLKLGYLAVAAYGPLILGLAQMDEWVPYNRSIAAYEVTALVATLLFIPLSRWTATVARRPAPVPRS